MVSHNNLRKKSHVPKEVKDYLMKYIKQGSSYEVIKTNLSKAGWPEKEIKRVYDLTTQENYFNYMKSKGKVSKGKTFHPLVPPNNQKIVVISVLSILIIDHEKSGFNVCFVLIPELFS